VGLSRDQMCHLGCARDIEAVNRLGGGWFEEFARVSARGHADNTTAVSR
jgi:hypothetical protein